MVPSVDMIDVEAAFPTNALLDMDVFIEMPEGLWELLLSQGVTLRDVIIKLLRAQYGLVQSPRLCWMELFSKILSMYIGLSNARLTHVCSVYYSTRMKTTGYRGCLLR